MNVGSAYIWSCVNYWNYTVGIYLDKMLDCKIGVELDTVDGVQNYIL